MTVADIGRVKPDSGLNLRAKPNGEKIGLLLHDEEVEILEEVSFFRVKTRSGKVGYVHGSYLEKMPSLDAVVADLPTPARPVLSEKFDQVTFAHDRFVGEIARVDRDFVPALNRLCGYAEDSDLKVWVTSSTRSLNRQVAGAIVPPASNSCHHVGHAIDMNLLLQGQLYNSKKLRRGNLPNLPAPVREFIDAIRGDDDLRWGGDFNVEDPVHIDDNLFRRQELVYRAKLLSRVDQLNA